MVNGVGLLKLNWSIGKCGEEILKDLLQLQHNNIEKDLFRGVTTHRGVTEMEDDGVLVPKTVTHLPSTRTVCEVHQRSPETMSKNGST